MSVGTMVLIVGMASLSSVLYFPFKKWASARSLERFLTHGFSRHAGLPVTQIDIPRGGHFVCGEAFDGKLDGGGEVVLLLGMWERGTVMVRGIPTAIRQRIGGLLTTTPTAESLARLKSNDLLLATAVAGKTLLLWSGLPTGPSMARHMSELAALLGTA